MILCCAAVRLAWNSALSTREWNNRALVFALWLHFVGLVSYGTRAVSHGPGFNLTLNEKDILANCVTHNELLQVDQPHEKSTSHGILRRAHARGKLQWDPFSMLLYASA